MKYSVIIPCFNAATTLGKTIDSILKCGLTDFEILLIDDGSRDNTPALCDRLAAQNDNIRVIHQPNAGVSAARNRGIEEAIGEYIWFFDADDLVDYGCMDRSICIIEQFHPDLLVFGMSFDYYHNDKLFKRQEFCYETETQMIMTDVDVSFGKLFWSNSLTSSCNKLFRLGLLKQNSLRFNSSLHSFEDFHFVLTVLQHCVSIYLLPQIIYRYIQPTNQPRAIRERDHDRMAQIENTAEYLTAFEPLLEKHQDILIALYYMMLKEKLSKQTPKQIAKTADEFRSGPYASEEMMAQSNSGQKQLAQKLLSGDYIGIFVSNTKARARKATVRHLNNNAFLRTCLERIRSRISKR